MSRRDARRSRRPAISVLCLTVLLGACSGPSETHEAQRLLDLYDPAWVRPAGAAPGAALPRTQWRFDGSAPPPPGTPDEPRLGWRAGTGVEGLRVEDGRLVGRSTSDFPILHVERTSGLDDGDLVHAVEVRMAASAGDNVAVSARGSEELDIEAVVGDAFPWRATSPLVADGELRPYLITSPFPVRASDVRHLMVRPVDVEGATFSIQSVRILFRREHLASIPSGPGWQGLDEIYRETLVTRVPQVLRAEVTLPSRPWLDLALGTPEDGALTFQVGVSTGAGAPEIALERTVTRPHRWEPARVDLSRWAGRTVTLSLELDAERDGALGFWGSPAVRQSLAPAPDPAAPQGVILIIADTLRRDHLSVYGYERDTSPVLERMAAAGVLFRDCVTQGTWTKVSAPSIFTGLHPGAHGIRDFGDRLPSSAHTLAEIYRAAGHATVAYSSVLFTGKFSNLHQGFEELHESGSLSGEFPSKTGREYVDRFLPWLDAHRDVPFFAVLHVFDPHDPYEPYRPYDTLYADPSWREEHLEQFEKVKEIIEDPLMKRFGMPSRDEIARAGFDPETYVSRDRDWYDGSIRALDAEIDRVLQRLRELGLDDRTLVAFTTDHGEEFLEHGSMFHGQSAYGELTDAPLILWGPSFLPEDVQVGETVQSIDLMPTLLALSGLEAPGPIHGQSLLPLLEDDPEGAGWVRRPALTVKARTEDLMGPANREEEAYALALPDWKLVRRIRRPGAALEYELYDRRNDPGDQNNLAEREAATVVRLAAELERWRAAAETGKLPSDEEAEGTLSAEQLQRLRSLGYVQ